MMFFGSYVADLWANHIAHSQASFEVLLQHDGDMMDKNLAIIAATSACDKIIYVNKVRRT